MNDYELRSVRFRKNFVLRWVSEDGSFLKVKGGVEDINNITEFQQIKND